MTLSKKLISFFSASVLCFVLLFLFSGCQKETTFSEFKQNYKNFLNEYENTFFQNGELKICYTQALQELIDENVDANILQKLSSDPNNNQAVLEPILNAVFQSVNFLIDTQTEDFSSNEITTLSQNLSDLKNNLNQLKRDKILLEQMANAGQNVATKFPIYRENFEKVLKHSIELAQNFFVVFEKNILKENPVAGRISPNYVNFLISKNLFQSAQVFSLFELPTIKNNDFLTTQNSCSQMLKAFLHSKEILATTFTQIRVIDLVPSQYEQNMIKIFNNLRSYQNIFESSLQYSCFALTKFSINTLRQHEANGTLSREQNILITAINNLLDVDFVTIKNYNKDLIHEINSWNNH